jgi:phage I-like protein
MLTARACNAILDGTPPPDWIQLLPAGPAITGADGRAWTLPDPQTLIATFTARNKPLVVDWEHSSAHRAPQGLDAPAAGWIDRLEARNGAIWGHVDWTPKAAQQLINKEYRFLSPSFTYAKPGHQIVALVSAGLTNQPNLNLTALNQEQSPMDLTAITAALGLAAGADIAAIVAAITALKSEGEGDSAAMNRSQPDLQKFIPRPDYDAALNRAANAEQKLAEIATAQLNQQIETALNTALKAGQICPATVEFYRAGCQKADGLIAFNQFLKTAPPVLGAAPDLDGKPPGGTATATNAELLAVSAQFGNSVEDLKQFGGLT